MPSSAYSAQVAQKAGNALKNTYVFLTHWSESESALQSRNLVEG